MTTRQYLVAAVDGVMGVMEYLGSQIAGFLQHYHCKNACEFTAFTAIVSQSVGLITLPNIAEFCSAIWLFGRVLEMVTGRPVHVLIGELRRWVRSKMWYW
jgi:hypothetical protein